MTEQVTATGNEQATRIDEEDIRLATGFADIFAAILLVFGFVALNGVAPGALGGALTVAAAVLFTTPLVRRRQFAASAIILSLAVAAGTIVLTQFAGTWAALFCAAAVAAYGWFFNIPIAKALGWIAGVATIALIGANAGDFGTFRALFAGLTLFGIAMWYDSSDRLRRTRASDTAFWLHLASAPLIVHGLFTLLGVNPLFGFGALFGIGSLDNQLGPEVVLPVFAVLTIVALVVDRRPILVSSISYLFAAVGSLLNVIEPGSDGGGAFLKIALAPGIIGLTILILAAAWTPLRSQLLRFVPDAIARFVPPGSDATAMPPRDKPAALPEAEAEPLRLVLGFNDLFVAMGCFALFVSTLILGSYLTYTALEATDFARNPFRSPHIWYPVLLPAVAVWAAAEYFVRGRRMAWPAVTLAIDFAIIAAIAGWLLSATLFLPLGDWSFGPNSTNSPSSGQAIAALLLACAIGVAANLAFWKRHLVPISFAFAMAALVPLLFIDQFARDWSAVGADSPFEDWAVRLALGGIVIFVLALFWDRSDPARQTQRADTAFWLHLLASLLLIPALFNLAMMLDYGWALVLAGFVGVAIFAVAIDRRAPLAVAMPFAVWALGEEVGGGFITLAFAATLLALALKWDLVRGLMLSQYAKVRPA